MHVAVPRSQVADKPCNHAEQGNEHTLRLATVPDSYDDRKSIKNRKADIITGQIIGNSDKNDAQDTRKEYSDTAGFVLRLLTACKRFHSIQRYCFRTS